MSLGKTCDKNDALDFTVWKEFDYHKPHLLFIRHHHMGGMDFLQNKERFNELVIYPQAQDAMFFGKTFKLEEACARMNSREWTHRKFHHHIKAWNIRLHKDVKHEAPQHRKDIQPRRSGELEVEGRPSRFLLRAKTWVQ
ncbi:hypothetical protein F5Y19DRAFT_52952 [Xylariaceae sp. FL1651]|nr:hypothetical protein F5Y19DRAFT_52952 [Xylariaceae sp. FL1651]